MQQLMSVWLALDGRKRFVVMLSSIAMFAAVIGLARLATSPNLVTLYSGLDSSAAGEVVKALEQQGVIFDVKNGSIYVDSQQRDQLRMSLASEGLPATNNQGYELLDNISGFGTTAQMFDVAYWRAKEGELARTIVASPQFSSARVHISNAPTQAFRKQPNPGASVTVSGNGNAVSSSQARALRYLVSSAVAGMEISDVSIIDGRNGVVVQDDAQATGAADSTDLEAKLKNNVVRLLEARVGQGNAVVEVSIEVNTESESFSERVFDPDSRVAISIQKEERSTNSNGTSGGAVTVASNLPDGDAAGSGSENSSQNTETSETTNYEVSETMREVVRNAGSVKRVSVAALVDGVYVLDPETNEKIWTPREISELDAFRELIASTIGFDESRGDTITLKSLQFQIPDAPEMGIEASFLQSLNFDGMRLLQVAVLAVVSLILGLFVLRPALNGNVATSLSDGPELSRLSAPISNQDRSGTEAAFAPANALTGEIEDDNSVPRNLATIDANAAPNLGSTMELATGNPVDRLKDMISDREDETVEILRNWIDDKGEHV